MRKHNPWLNSFVILIIFIVLVDVNINRLKNPSAIDSIHFVIFIVCAVLLLALLIWNLFSNKQSKKSVDYDDSSKG